MNSCIVQSHQLYEIVYCMNFICHSPPTPNSSSNSGPQVVELQCTSCICGNQLCPQAWIVWCVFPIVFYIVVYSLLMYVLKSLHVFFLMYQVDSWEDMTDDAGNTLHIGKLEYKTKHGKKPGFFGAQVFPRDVKSALCLVVNLFLEQPKVND